MREKEVGLTHHEAGSMNGALSKEHDITNHNEWMKRTSKVLFIGGPYDGVVETRVNGTLWDEWTIDGPLGKAMYRLQVMFGRPIYFHVEDKNALTPR